jgi:hypothetical protein
MLKDNKKEINKQKDCGCNKNKNVVANKNFEKKEIEKRVASKIYRTNTKLFL